MSWEIIDKHRANARSIVFDILIWGPSETDSSLYVIRKEIKDYCNSNGHSAKFSEDLIKEGTIKSAPNPIIDEFFHADAAQIIIVLYESRGTQTEYDRILKYHKFLTKALIFVEEATWKRIGESLSGYEWINNRNNIKIIKEFNSCVIISTITKCLEDKQFDTYLRRLEMNLISLK